MSEIDKGINQVLSSAPSPQHPIEEGVWERVNKALDEIEKKYNVTIIYACESGSRGWGFPSTNSDYDVRFIYVNKPDHYVRVDNDARDTIEEVIDFSTGIDINGWNITKTLGLAYKSNPTLIEWLESPVVYRQVHEDREKLLEIARQYFLPYTAYKHYYSMAKTTWKQWIESKENVRLKKYFYVIRPLLAADYIERFLKPAPMRFQELMDNATRITVKENTMLTEVDALIRLKRSATEQLLSDHIKPLDAYIEMKFAEPEPVFPEYTRLDIYVLSELSWSFVKKYADKRL